MTDTEKQIKIKSFLDDFKTEFQNSNIVKHTAFKSLVVIGSYADWIKNPNSNISPSWKSVPDINIYIIIDGDESDHLIISNELASIYKKFVNKNEINFLLDLHPFFKSYGNVYEDRLNLQLTTRVINTHNPYVYPDYCWLLWKVSYLVLCGDNDPFKFFTKTSALRDERWIRYMYMAISSYSNAVHMSALSYMFESDEFVFDEIYRYTKEIIKDGISLGIPIKDNDDFDYYIVKKWKSSLPEFYEKHYGPKAKEIILKILSYESNYFECRKTIPIKTFLKDFADLKNIIYTNGFLNRLNELHLSDNNFLKVLPLWY